MSDIARLGVVIDPSGAQSGAEAVNRALHSMKAEASRVMNDLDRLGSNLQKSFDITGVIFNIQNAFAALGAGMVFRDLVNMNSEFERMKAALETVEGSQAKAAVKWAELLKIAEKTPYTLDQSVNAYLRLKAMGLDPSERAIMSYGNTASAMGRNLMDFVNAVSQATNMEFMPLRTFGIRAIQETDHIKMIFGGVTTEIGKDAKSIQDYLLKIGETQFAGGMLRQMDTLGGKLSNLEDVVDRVKGTIGEAGFTDAVSKATEGFIGFFENLLESGTIDKIGQQLGKFVEYGSGVINVLIGAEDPLDKNIKLYEQMAKAVEAVGVALAALTAAGTMGTLIKLLPMLANPWALGLTAISGAIGVGYAYRKEIAAMLDPLEEQRQRLDETKERFAAIRDRIPELAERFLALSVVEEKSAEQKKKYNEILNEMIQLMPQAETRLRQIARSTDELAEKQKALNEITEEASHEYLMRQMEIEERLADNAVQGIDRRISQLKQSVQNIHDQGYGLGGTSENDQLALKQIAFFNQELEKLYAERIRIREEYEITKRIMAIEPRPISSDAFMRFAHFEQIWSEKGYESIFDTINPAGDLTKESTEFDKKLEEFRNKIHEERLESDREGIERYEKNIKELSEIIRKNQNEIDDVRLTGLDKQIRAVERSTEQELRILDEKFKYENELTGEYEKARQLIIENSEAQIDKVRSDYAEKQREEEQRKLDQLTNHARMITEQFDPLAKMQSEVEDLNELRDKGLISSEVHSHALVKVNQELRNSYKDLLMTTREWSAGAIAALSDYAETATDAARNSYEAFSRTFRSLEDELTSMFTTLKFDFQSLFQQIQNDIVRMAVRQQITGPLAAGMGLGMGGQSSLFNYGQGSANTGMFGSFGGFLSNIFSFLNPFGGFRAGGGPVEPGNWYVVGERRPEIFVPDQRGQILPVDPTQTNSARESGYPGVVIQNLHLHGVTNERAGRRTARQVANETYMAAADAWRNA
jgi:lambda family phage tail tape measure protein